MKQKRFSIRGMIAAVLLSIALTLGAGFGALWVLLKPQGVGMVEAMVLINTLFVGEHDLETATDQAMNALVQGLGDRWSYYMDAESYQRQIESKENAYVGIGATIQLSGNEGDVGLLVMSVVEGGPADQAGLVAGDVILSIDGIVLEGEDRSRGSELSRGPAGSTAAMVVRGSDGTERNVDVIRGRVEEHPVSYTLLEDNTGLVTIKNFNSRCAEEAIAAVDALMAQGAERLVFDVRNNGGGYLDELTKLLDYLLPEGVIFRSETKAGQKGKVESDASCVELPMAVLVNENTYSAAELFAAELQEMDWAIIVGSQTFGKGFSQQTFPLLYGGAINISTAKYFTGNGVSLIGTGLTLDIEVDGDVTSPSDPQSDTQLKTAIAAIK